MTTELAFCPQGPTGATKIRRVSGANPAHIGPGVKVVAAGAERAAGPSRHGRP